MEDLAGFEVSFRTPVTSTYRGYEIISAPPPSSGGTHVIELLNIMENFDVEKMGLNSSPEYPRLGRGDEVDVQRPCAIHG